MCLISYNVIPHMNELHHNMAYTSIHTYIYLYSLIVNSSVKINVKKHLLNMLVFRWYLCFVLENIFGGECSS